jgi:hypothetical protein
VTGRPDALAAARSSDEDNGTSGVVVEAVWQYFYVVDTCQNALAFPSFFFFFLLTESMPRERLLLNRKKRKKKTAGEEEEEEKKARS